MSETEVRDALLSELAEEHGCAGENIDTGRLTSCVSCAERAVRLAARLQHEGIVAPAPAGDSGGERRG